MSKRTNAKNRVTYCVYTQFLKTILTFLSFLYFLTCLVRLHPFTKIPVQNDWPSIFSNCIHEVIQVEQKCCVCKQKWYTSILLPLNISFEKWENSKSFCRLKNDSTMRSSIQLFFCENWSSYPAQLWHNFACTHITNWSSFQKKYGLRYFLHISLAGARWPELILSVNWSYEIDPIR